MLGKGVQERHIRRTWGSPRGADGRALALRVRKGMMHVVLGVFYFPVQPAEKGMLGAYRQTVKKLVG